MYVVFPFMDYEMNCYLTGRVFFLPFILRAKICSLLQVRVKWSYIERHICDFVLSLVVLLFIGNHTHKNYVNDANLNFDYFD